MQSSDKPEASLNKEETSRKEEEARPLAEQLLPLHISTPTIPPPARRKKKKKGCLCACFIIVILIILLVIAAVLVGKFYILKQKQLKITSNNAYLVNLSYSIVPLNIELVLGMSLSINNPNYAGFEYTSTAATVYYHGMNVGFATVPGENIKARSNSTVNSTIYVDATKMLSSSYLLQELMAGKLPVSTSMKLNGNIVALKIIKLKARVDSSCDMLIEVNTFKTNATCKSSISY